MKLYWTKNQTKGKQRSTMKHEKKGRKKDKEEDNKKKAYHLARWKIGERGLFFFYKWDDKWEATEVKIRNNEFFLANKQTKKEKSKKQRTNRTRWIVSSWAEDEEDEVRRFKFDSWAIGMRDWVSVQGMWEEGSRKLELYRTQSVLTKLKGYLRRREWSWSWSLDDSEDLKLNHDWILIEH